MILKALVSMSGLNPMEGVVASRFIIHSFMACSRAKWVLEDGRGMKNDEGCSMHTATCSCSEEDGWRCTYVFYFAYIQSCALRLACKYRITAMLSVEIVIRKRARSRRSMLMASRAVGFTFLPRLLPHS